MFDVNVMQDGKHAASVQAYRSGKTTFLNAAQACRALGGQPNWYQVSGRLFCSVRGKKVFFATRRAVARLGERELSLEAPVAVRTGQAFVPVSFFISAEFSSFLGQTLRFDHAARVLELEKAANVGALRRREQGPRTFFELELKEPLKSLASPKGRNRVDVVLQGGVVAREESWKGTGPVREARLEQERGAVRLVLILADPAVRYAVEARPDRLVVEAVSREAAAAPAPSTDGGRRKRRVVVDAGHGGKDPGTMGRGLKEKDIVLAISKELATLLEESGDFEVLLTRDADVFVPLEKRSEMANQFQADLFISVHVNYHEDSRESGMEVFFLSEKASNTEAALVAQFENSVLGLQESKPQDLEAALILSEMEKSELINESALLAGYVAKAVDRRVDVANRGVKQAQFFVLHWTRAPAVLVETAYLSNAKDAAKLSSKTFRRKLAEALYEGVLGYGKKKEWL